MSKKVINPFQKSHNRPFIVAELSGNHGQSLQKAKKLVNATYDAMIKSIDEEDIDKMLDSIDEQIKKDIKGE